MQNADADATPSSKAGTGYKLKQTMPEALNNSNPLISILFLKLQFGEGVRGSAATGKPFKGNSKPWRDGSYAPR